MWENSSTLHEEDARTVVSLRGEILSPKYAPDIIAPAIHPGENPMARPIPMKATPMVAMVVQDEPVSTEIRADTAQAVTKKKSGLSTCMPYSIISGTTPESIHVEETVPISKSMGSDGSTWRNEFLSPNFRPSAVGLLLIFVTISDRAAAPRRAHGPSVWTLSAPLFIIIHVRAISRAMMGVAEAQSGGRLRLVLFVKIP